MIEKKGNWKNKWEVEFSLVVLGLINLARSGEGGFGQMQIVQVP